MIGERTAMSIHQEIARLRSAGMGKKKIARTLGIGVEKVQGICRDQEVGVARLQGEPLGATMGSMSWFDRIQWARAGNYSRNRSP